MPPDALAALQGVVDPAAVAAVSAADICPECGAELEYDEVDIGVGTQRGNPGCPECHWTPTSESDRLLLRQGCDCDCCDHSEGSDCACTCHRDGLCSFQSEAT
jgi:hypothetical protein